MKMDEDWTLTSTTRLSRRFTVKMTIGATGSFVCEWDPATPDSQQAFNKKELRAYRQARHELLERAAKRLGGSILVLEA
jgi:hypothetical protein